MKHVLITGASGLIGKPLTVKLLSLGYTVSHLSRKKKNIPGVRVYRWNINRGLIDKDCLSGVDTIIHLAGTGIADKRWTRQRKQEIVNSRVKSIEILYDLMRNGKHSVKNVLSASATGYYSNRGEELMTEESRPANDFLGTCCVLWEQAVDKGTTLGLEITKLRTGVVLSTKGGALKPLALPVKFGVGTPLGNGEQWVPWIHIEDAVKMYVFALENNIRGVFNMVAPNPVTNYQLTKAVAGQLHRPLWLPNVPEFVLKLIFGEMSAVVLGSTKVSPEKIIAEGFEFNHPDLPGALKQLYE